MKDMPESSVGDLYCMSLAAQSQEMKSYLLLLMITGGVNTWKVHDSDESKLITSNIQALLQQVLPQMSPCVVVVYSSSDDTMLLPHELNAIRVKWDSLDLKEVLTASYSMKCNGYVADFDSAERMLTALSEARLNAVVRLVPRVLVLPSNGLHDRDGCLLFKHPEALFIPDMLVVTLAGNSQEGGVLNLLTSPFVSENYPTCEVLSHWPSMINDFFPDKMKNLEGKVVRVSTLDYPPYSLLHPEFDGIEARLLIEFCRKYNCKLSVHTDDYLWGTIYENRTGNGILGNVYMDLADFGIGAVYAWDYEYNFIDYAYPYSHSRITLLVPKPQRLAEWRVPLLPFSLTMWLMQLFSVISAASVLFAVNKASTIQSKVRSIGLKKGEMSSFGGSVLRALAMAVLQPPPSSLPSSSPLRVFFTIFEVLFLFLTTLYSGGLSSFLTVPMYQPPIDSPREMYEAGIPWAANHIAWTYSLKGNTEPYLEALVERFEVHDTQTLIELSKKGGYAFSIEIMAAGHVTQTEHLSGEMILGLHVMKKELYTSLLVLILRKGSPYMDKLNELLGRCRDTGLLLLWETDVILNYLSSRLQIALKISEGHHVEVQEPAQLKIIHLQGALILLSIGLAVSLLVFIFELMKYI